MFNPVGTKYGYILSCTFSDDDGCLHNYHILYNIDDFEDLVFVAEEQRSEQIISIRTPLDSGHLYKQDTFMSKLLLFHLK